MAASKGEGRKGREAAMVTGKRKESSTSFSYTYSFPTRARHRVGAQPIEHDKVDNNFSGVLFRYVLSCVFSRYSTFRSRLPLSERS